MFDVIRRATNRRAGAARFDSQAAVHEGEITKQTRRSTLRMYSKNMQWANSLQVFITSTILANIVTLYYFRPLFGVASLYFLSLFSDLLPVASAPLF